MPQRPAGITGSLLQLPGLHVGAGELNSGPVPTKHQTQPNPMLSGVLTFYEADLEVPKLGFSVFSPSIVRLFYVEDDL